jgi:hypothetical protein
MANVTIVIPEAQVTRVKKALIAFTGLPEESTAKQLATAALKQVVVSAERQYPVAPPELE